MALPLPQFPVSSSFAASPRTILTNTSSRINFTPTFTQSLKQWSTTNRNKKFLIINATEEDNTSTNSGSETLSTPNNEPLASNKIDMNDGGDELSELGSEIKNAMKDRKEKGGDDFWSGVAVEIGEIEWPPFNKVLGTTGVVLGVIAGSSVVLLTVNAVLAELSDRVFVGRGVQDFFG